jgi:DNA-binding MarR family transcriptional regulator
MKPGVSQEASMNTAHELDAIVAGVDGSRAALQAVRWAAVENVCFHAISLDTGPMSRAAGEGGIAGSSAEQIEAVVLATRVLVAVTARSLAHVEDQVTLPQFRVLVMIASRGSQNLTSVAQGLGIHASNATRLCDKLVEAGLIQRSEDPVDRRNVVLRLSASGYHLVTDVTDQRRAAIAEVLAKMSPELRDDLVPVLRGFAQAGGEISPEQVWALGWSTEEPVDLHTNDEGVAGQGETDHRS